MEKTYNKIIYLISLLDIYDGASDALCTRIRREHEAHPEVEQIVVYKWKGQLPEDIECIHIDDIYIRKVRVTDRTIIHYYKATNSNIYKKFLHYINCDRIPIVMTVCQNPVFRNLLLSPYEIRTAWNIVFIDKNSYNNTLLAFIAGKKRLIYLAYYPTSVVEYYESLKISPKTDNPQRIIFGRGTTLSKCPKDMFDVFDKIDIPNKEFHIVGIPDNNNWVRKEACKRNNVRVYGLLSREDWIKKCSEFDICLYHIPENSHVSLDYNLGLAMLLEIPVVYKGAEAPKERFENGVNGYVANTNDELILYAVKLGLSYNDRQIMGQRAKESQLSKFNVDPNDAYYHLYINLKDNIRINIPLQYKIKYYRRCLKDELQMFFNIYRRRK